MKTKLIFLCLLGAVFLRMVNAQSPADPAEAMRERIVAKVERVKQGAQKWAASGRNPSAIVKTLQETIKPLLDAGKASEAEAGLDRVLEQLKSDAKAPDGRQATLAKSSGKVRTDPADHFSVWISKADGSE